MGKCGGRMNMKEYEIKKTIELTFFVEADSEKDAIEEAWYIDDGNAVDYVVYDIEILNPDEEDWEDDEDCYNGCLEKLSMGGGEPMLF